MMTRQNERDERFSNTQGFPVKYQPQQGTSSFMNQPIPISRPNPRKLHQIAYAKLYPNYKNYNKPIQDGSFQQSLPQKQIYLPPQRRQFLNSHHLNSPFHSNHQRLFVQPDWRLIEQDIFGNELIPAAVMPIKHEYIPFRLQEVNLGSHEVLGLSKYKEDYANFQYRYLNGIIAIELPQKTVKIYIPLEAIQEIHQIGRDTLVLCLHADRKHMIQYKILDQNHDHQKFPVMIDHSSTIRFVADPNTPRQKVDLIRIHVNFEIQKSRVLKVPSLVCVKAHKFHPPGTIFSAGDEMASITTNSTTDGINPSGNLLIKFHYNGKGSAAKGESEAEIQAQEDEIRLFSFSPSIKYDSVKKIIQQSYDIPEIKEMACRVNQNDGVSPELFVIRSENEWNTALTLHVQPNKKFELWWIE
ncbi:hypothetical protein G9A89_010084 [Geosiphon pyriformis]|nr:hypothetical protein G9A89_010084 [Geosiphon pyriformis]